MTSNEMEPAGSEEDGAVGGKPPTAENGSETDNNNSTGYNNTNHVTRENILYTYTDTPPNRVYVELVDQKAQNAKINKFALGATLRKIQGLRGHIIDMKYVGRYKIIVLLNNFIKANLMVQTLNEENTYYRAYIPAHLVAITGKITGIPTHITEEEIKNDLECESQVLQVRRLHRYEEGVKIPVNTVSIMFRANQLPEKVKLMSCVTRVLPFVRRVDLCEKCLRYGHRTVNCKGARRCRQCGNRHDEESEYDQCQKPIRCAGCRTEGHSATDPNCPERKRQANINAIRAKRNLTYVEAREQCPILCSNGYEMLSNIQDHPTLTETYSSTTKSNDRPNESLRQQWERTNLPRQSITPAVKWWNTEEKNKEDKRRKPKRQRKSDPETGLNMEVSAEDHENSEAGTSSVNGVGLNNTYRVQEIERVQGLIQDATRKALESANRGFQEQVMKFFSMVIEQGLPDDVQDKFECILKECFDLKKTIV